MDEDKISLKTALKIIGKNKETDVIYLRHPEDDPKYQAKEAVPIKDLREKYDENNTFVTRIHPYFVCDEYAGFLLTITEEE